MNWRRPFLCWFKHKWQTKQYSINAACDARVTFVIAWKQCPRCGGSKLVHILV